jgi:hypothetical protein
LCCSTHGTIELDSAYDELDHHLDHFTEANVPLPQLVEIDARLRQRAYGSRRCSPIQTALPSF